MSQRMEAAEDWAKNKFWGTPDMLEKMVPHLDSSTILILTEVNKEVCAVILKVLESGPVWGELIKRTCDNNFGDQAKSISDLGKILSKMDNSDNPQKKKDLELALLHLLCSSHLPAPYEKIKVSCPCKDESHPVSQLGFTFLEMVESAIGSTEQNVVEAATSLGMDSISSALGSRMQRQEHMIEVLDVGGLSCLSLACVKAAPILNKTVRVNWRGGVFVERDIGEEGWAALASGLQRHPGFTIVVVPRAIMLQAPRAVLKIIWDSMGALGTPSQWWVLTDDLTMNFKVLKDGVTEEGDKLKWEELLKMLDMTDSQFMSQFESSSEREEGEGEDDYGDEAGEEDEQI